MRGGGADTCDSPGTMHAGRSNGRQGTLQLSLVTATPTDPSAFHRHWALVAITTGDHISICTT